jgi:hypothetical protein
MPAMQPPIHGYSHSPLTRMQPLADLYCTLYLPPYLEHI